MVLFNCSKYKDLTASVLDPNMLQAYKVTEVKYSNNILEDPGLLYNIGEILEAMMYSNTLDNHNLLIINGLSEAIENINRLENIEDQMEAKSAIRYFFNILNGYGQANAGIVIFRDNLIHVDSIMKDIDELPHSEIVIDQVKLNVFLKEGL